MTRAKPQATPCALLVGALVIGLVAAGCGRHGKPAPVGGSDIPPSKVNLKRNVELCTAEHRSLTYNVDTVGFIEAEGSTEIAAGVKGVVDEVLFREGDFVSANTVLVKVDQRYYETVEKAAQAALERSRAQVAQAQDKYKRSLAAGTVTSPEERTQTKLGLDVALADVESAKANLEQARNNLDRSRVRAPYTGRINQRKVTRGSYLEDKTVIATMADLTRMRLVGWVPEYAEPMVRKLMRQQDARSSTARLTLPLSGFASEGVPWAMIGGQILAAQKVVPSGYDPEFTLMPFPDHKFRARIFYLSTVAASDTHMFELKAEIDVEGSDIELRPGYTARIRIPVQATANAVVIPEESVRASERGFIAFVPVQRTLRDGSSEWIARARTLDLGYRAPGWVEVRSGIKPGEKLVRRGAEALEDGTPIKIVE